MTRLLAVGVFVIGASSAPFQCGHDPDPDLRRDDTAGDALWELSQRFRSEHNDAAARETLRYLVERYPSNRHATEAKEALQKEGALPAESASPSGSK